MKNIINKFQYAKLIYLLIFIYIIILRYVSKGCTLMSYVKLQNRASVLVNQTNPILVFN